MQIEEGKFYRTRDGRKAGPAAFDMPGQWLVRSDQAHYYRDDGYWTSPGCPDGLDLIAEWTEDQHEGTVSLDNHALPDAIIPTMSLAKEPWLYNERPVGIRVEPSVMSPAEALQELDLREREDDPMHGLSVKEFVSAYQSAARSIYLSGPMKGYPQSNYPLFNAVAEQLRRAGHRVYNPAEFGAETPFDGFPIRQAFAAYSKFICEEADAIILLPGWEASRGANAEHALAENCGIEIIPFDRLSTTIATEGTF